MVQILLLAHKFRNKDQKKVFGTKSSTESWHLLLFFVLERIFTHAVGAQAVFWESTGPEMHSSGTGPGAFFGGTFLTWGSYFSLGGA